MTNEKTHTTAEDAAEAITQVFCPDQEHAAEIITAALNQADAGGKNWNRLDKLTFIARQAFKMGALAAITLTRELEARDAENAAPPVS